jgi:hypothetical protein
MPDPSIQTSAELILRLYEIRREPDMRRARQWFSSEFRPTSASDLGRLLLSGERASANYRMVTSYWDMASAMVNHGAIDSGLFDDCTSESIFFFTLLEPYLAEFRETIGESDYLANWEKALRANPNAAQRMAARKKLLEVWTATPAA